MRLARRCGGGFQPGRGPTLAARGRAPERFDGAFQGWVVGFPRAARSAGGGVRLPRRGRFREETAEGLLRAGRYRSPLPEPRHGSARAERGRPFRTAPSICERLMPTSLSMRSSYSDSARRARLWRSSRRSLPNRETTAASRLLETRPSAIAPAVAAGLTRGSCMRRRGAIPPSFARSRRGGKAPAATPYRGIRAACGRAARIGRGSSEPILCGPPPRPPPSGSRRGRARRAPISRFGACGRQGSCREIACPQSGGGGRPSNRTPLTRG